MSALPVAADILSRAGGAGHVALLLAEPGAHRTTPGGSKLRQIGLLELWLQTHEFGSR